VGRPISDRSGAEETERSDSVGGPIEMPFMEKVGRLEGNQGRVQRAD
jgi:hypothetical protein